MKCNCKVVINEEKVALGRCGMLQGVDRCKMQITAQLLIEAGRDMHTLQAFTKTAIEIAQTTDVTEEALLNAKLFLLRYSEKNVIWSVTRKVD